jgi:hypothetical protein
MPALKNPRHETFAQSLAEDLSPVAAYRASGFNGKPRGASTTANRIAKRADVVKRVDELRQDMNWGATSDIPRIINELAWLVRRARTMDSPAALTAAKGILVEMARLMGRQGDTGAEFADPAPPEPPMSIAEWRAAYAPQE